MREILTAVAAILIVLLVAALVAPFVVDWTDHRRQIDARLTEAAGIAVHTEGDIALRLLPSPRLRLATVLIGGDDASEGSTARLDGLDLELGLLPLAQKTLKVTDLRLERADVTVTTDASGAFFLPMARQATGRPWTVAIDRLSLANGTLRIVGEDGRRTIVAPLTVLAEGADLKGPWRIQSAIGAFPLRIVTGTPEADGRLRVKMTGGGDTFPRVEFEGLVGNTIDGTGRIGLGPPGQALDSGLPVPVALSGALSGPLRDIKVKDAVLEVAEGPKGLRFEGSGSLSGREPRLSLALRAAHMDADAFLLSPAGKATLQQGWRGFGAHWPLPTDFALAVDSVTLGNEETGSLQAALTVDVNGAALKRFSAVLPGRSRVSFDGDDNASLSHLFGRLTMDVEQPEPLASFLAQLHGPATFARLSGGKPFRVQGELIATSDVFAARDLRWTSGEASMSGTMRFAPPEKEGDRPRLEAQLTARGYDLAALPSLDGLRQNLAPLDLSLVLDARDIRYGANLRTGSTLQARLTADGAGLNIETLDVADVAGASASAAGRIDNAGNGAIEGSVSAAAIGPLATVLGKLWGGEAAVSGTPQGILDAPLTGRFSLVAAAAAEPQDALVARLDGRSGDMLLNAQARFRRAEDRSVEGLRNAALTLKAPDGRGLLRLVGLDVPALPAGPGEASFALADDERAELSASLRAAGAGWSVATSAPIPIRGRIDTRREGRFHIVAADATPWMREWKLAADATPRPAEFDITVSPVSGRWLALPSGQIGTTTLKGSLTVNPASRAVSGELALSAASLPVLGAWAGLRAEPPPPAGGAVGGVWSARRFLPPDAPPFTTEIRITADKVDLGDGRVGSNGAATLLIAEDAVSLRPAQVDYAGTSLSGDIAVTRQGGRASLAGEIAVADALALDPAARAIMGGQLALKVRFGSAAETPSTLVANLSGAGQATWRAPSVAGAAPGAVLAAASAGARSEGNVPTADELKGELARALDAGRLSSAPGGVSEAPAVLTGGQLRAGPFLFETPEARFNGQIVLDLRSLALEARAALQATASPPGWIGGAPQIALRWTGPVGAVPQREVDAGPLANGIAALRLSKEVEKIERMEQDDRERAAAQRRLRAERERRAPPAPAPQPPAPPPVAEPAARPAPHPAPQPVPMPQPLTILPPAAQ